MQRVAPSKDLVFLPSGRGHHAGECGQGPGEGPEAVGAGRPGRRPAGRSLAVREQRCQTQEQILVEKLQGGPRFGVRRVCRGCFPIMHQSHSGFYKKTSVPQCHSINSFLAMIKSVVIKLCNCYEVLAL